MCSYQQINNSYGCQNSYTLNYLLKEELDFQGFGELFSKTPFIIILTWWL